MKEPFAKNDIKIAVLGGGTGSFMLLSALKIHTKQLAAIVNMVDDGGSTGVLRDEFGTLPPGDVRQCLVALSNSKKVRDLFNYRFDSGMMDGHSFGNILLTALEKMTGSFSEAIETASDILGIDGMVIPGTLDNIRLKMAWPEVSTILNGEREIDAKLFKYDPRRANLSLVPSASANPMALKAIEQANIVVIAPGDLYTSVGPIMIIDGIAEALQKTKAICIYACNLVTKKGQTTKFSVSDHVKEIERFAGVKFVDYVIYNKQIPDKEILEKYKKEKAYLVRVDINNLTKMGYKSLGFNLLGDIVEPNMSDKFLPNRQLIRHDGEALARAILDIYRSQTNN